MNEFPSIDEISAEIGMRPPSLDDSPEALAKVTRILVEAGVVTRDSQLAHVLDAWAAAGTLPEGISWPPAEWPPEDPNPNAEED